MPLARTILLLAAPAVLSAQFTVPALKPPELAQILKAGKWTVIEFGGPTCIPCRQMQPILGRVQARLGDRVQIRNFYVTQNPDQAREYKIMSIPTQVVFDPSGKEVKRHVGVWEETEFLAGLAGAGLK